MKIFVFGSNLAGRHGAGSAKEALNNHGAVYGQGIGLQGRSYAIPTKDKALNRLSLSTVKGYIDDFLNFADHHPEMTFNVVKVGCGLAGFTEEQIRPLFKNHPKNVILHTDWEGTENEIKT